MTLTRVLQFILFGTWLTQSVPLTTLRTGEVARQLTEQDVAALERVIPSGKKPWLLNGDPAQLASSGQLIIAYLPPNSETAIMRSGSIVGVRRGISPPTPWTVDFEGMYAQVAIAGRPYDQIQGDQDENRPFAVTGVDDIELVQVVQYLRSKPVPESEPGTRWVPIQSWPILSVSRQKGDSVRIMLRENNSKGQMVTMRKAGSSWVVLSVSSWLA